MWPFNLVPKTSINEIQSSHSFVSDLNKISGSARFYIENRLNTWETDKVWHLTVERISHVGIGKGIPMRQ